jgi:hypothetical protein
MRNLTKASREASRAAQFESLLKCGYQRETYKGLEIFADFKDFTLKVYQGTAAEPLFYYRFRTAESMRAKIEETKKNYDSREAWKAEQKEKNKGKSSSHAATAAAIREDLKKVFKGFKFSVTSEQFAGGDSVRISWTNGPTTDEVQKISSKYEMGQFNGMEDIYEYSNRDSNLPQVKYVSESRTVSEEILTQIKTDICSLMNFENASYRDEPQQVAYKIASVVSFPLNFTGFKTVLSDKESGSGYESFFKLVFEGATEPQPEKEKDFQAVEVKEGEIQVLEYSQFSFAVIGEKTKEIKTDLMSLGGKYNKFLKCGAGFIFSNKRLDDVVTFLSGLNPSNEVEPQKEEEEPQNTLKNEVENTYIELPQNLEVPKIDFHELEFFTIIWHEGRQIPSYENKTFFNWDDVQKAFFNLWNVNEKGQNGGYSKVKCNIKFKNKEAQICRIDITNKIQNGDFNPSDEHIISYLKANEEPEQNYLRHPNLDPLHPLNICDPESGQYKQALKEFEQAEEVKEYKNIKDLENAAKSGKMISLLNMCNLVNA